MRNTLLCCGAFGLGFVLPPALFAQQNEISVLAGAVSPSTNVGVASLVSVSGGTSFSIMLDYAHRLKETSSTALYFELPATRVAKTSVNVSPTEANVAKSQFFFTPGVRLHFLPSARLSPYVAGGFGFGWFDTGDVTINIQSDSPYRINVPNGFKPAFGFGGGAALRVTRLLGVRAEVRDYVPVVSGVKRHSVVFAAGFSFHF